MKTIAAIFAVLFLLLLAGVGLKIYLDENRVHEISFAASSRHGDSYALAKAIADVVRKYHPNIRIEVLETRGSDRNMELLGDKKVELASVHASTPALPSARLIALLYPEYFQLLVREDSDIRNVEDLRGHRIALPPRGSGDYNSFWFLAQHYGLASYEFDALPMSPPAASFALLAGAADAVFRVQAPGNPSIANMVKEANARFVPIDQAAAMGIKQPAVDVGAVPKGSYQGTPPRPVQDLPSASVQRLMAASSDLDPAVAAAIAGVLFERRQDLIERTPLAGLIAPPDRSAGTFLPVHAGAALYYDREKPSFLQENAEPIALVLSLGAILGSGLLGIKSRWEKSKLNRVDTYNYQVMALVREAEEATDRGELLKLRGRLLDVLEHVVQELDKERVTTEGFQSFSFAWDAAHALIRDQLDLGHSTTASPRTT